MHRASKIFWGTSLFLSAVSPLAYAQPAGQAEAADEAVEPKPAETAPEEPVAPPPPDATEAPQKPTDAPAVDEENTSETGEDGAAEPAGEEPRPEPDATSGTTTGGAETGGAAELPPTPADPFPSPASDAATLAQQGAEGPDGNSSTTGEPPAAPSTFVAEHAFAEDWWSHARPILELHGYLRTRAELFHNFSLERLDAPSNAIWPRAPDNRYTTATGSELGPALCTIDETDLAGTDKLRGCDNETQAGANIRLRLSPEIHVSDNLRVISQIDLLDNLVLGSTPRGWYDRLGFDDGTQVPPARGSNSFTDSVVVKRAWGEYTTPLGELRFGRMPDHWGLGMLYNAGDGHDDDYQSTIDRFLVTTGFSSLDLVLSASWDFPGEGALGSIQMPGAQPYDLASLDDVNQWSFSIMRKKSEQLEKLALARGDLLLSGGLYFKYRTQTLANEQADTQGSVVANAEVAEFAQTFSRREAEAFIPDLWFQLKYKKFRFELEFASILGSIGSTDTAGDNAADFDGESAELKLAQFGLATEIEQKFIEDRLRLNFKFGWASGDADAFDESIPGDLIPGPNQGQVNDDTDSTFRFHPGYRVDLILNRNILQRVQGTYFINPGVEYDFIRNPNGQRAGGGIQAIWTRATEFIQAPGHARDLGIELNGTVYFQAKDGGLNDTPDAMGGFYSALQYGVLFPLRGMGYLPREVENIGGDPETSAAQIVRMYLGVLF